MPELPSHARVVIIGGGAIGTSIAYHLAKMGERDVLLLEKTALTAGSTWHAAGLMGQLRSKVNLTRLMQDSADLCSHIGAETGQDVGWKNVGSLRLAAARRAAEFADAIRLPDQQLSQCRGDTPRRRGANAAERYPSPLNLYRLDEISDRAGQWRGLRGNRLIGRYRARRQERA